ncbi:MAG: small GTP-binding protein [Saprospiraceae bacterium]|jgi:small GTP-binding protein
MISKKIILTGSFGVGKTSLFNKFIYNKFDDKYLTTIGVKVNKKSIEIEGEEVSLLLWDIAGEVSQDKIPNSYFLGSSGIIYVFDLTRPSTYRNIASDIEHLQTMANDAIIKIVGNKSDLVTPDQIAEIKGMIQTPWDIITSAKTGENVDDLFYNLGKAFVG